MYEALALGRFLWRPKGAKHYRPNYDIERRLTRTGWSVIVDGEIIPVRRVDWRNMNETRELTADDGTSRVITSMYSDVIKVAEAVDLVAHVNATEIMLRDALRMQVILSRVPNVVVADESAADFVSHALGEAEHLAAFPIIKMPNAAELPTTIKLTDGTIHTAELSQAHALNVVTAAQALGIHTSDVIKAERLLSDEVESLSEVVELIAETELREREFVASVIGWEVIATAKREKETDGGEEDERTENN